MNSIIRILSAAFRKSLRLYPLDYRNEFADEMCLVFQEAIEEASRRGLASMMVVWLREVRGWPAGALRQHWMNIKGRALERLVPPSLKDTPPHPLTRRWRSDMPETRSNPALELDNRRLAIVAALPLFLIGLGIALTSLVRGGRWYAVPSWRLILSIAVGFLPMAVVALGGMVGLYRRLPDWGLTWVGSASMGFTLFVKTMAEERADVGMPLTTQAGDIVITVLLLLVGIVMMGIVAWKGWRRAGLFSIGLSGTLGLSLCMVVTAAPFYRHDMALLGIPLGMAAGGLVYGYARGSDSTRIAVILGMGVINTGAFLMSNLVWRGWLLSHGRSSLVPPLLVLSMGLLAAGPLLALLARPLRRALGRA